MAETESHLSNTLGKSSGDRLKCLDEYLAGVNYDKRSSVVRRLALRERVLLKRESNNAADPNAIIVERRGGTQIGYIRRKLAAYLAPHMDQPADPIPATITELSSDVAGSTCRVRVRFCIPPDWLKPRRDGEEPSAETIEYYYDDSGITPYVLLNCSEEFFNQIKQRLSADKIQYSRSGLCYRPASNGRQYQWYIRINETGDLNGPSIAEFFKRHFNVFPDTLEGERQRLQAEIAHLRESLFKARKEAEGYADLAGEIDKEGKQKIDYLEKVLSEREREVERLEGERRRLRYGNKSADRSSASTDAEDSLYDVPDHVADAFIRVAGESLTPVQSLGIVGKLFPNRLEILPTAWNSAKIAKSFKRRKELFELLWLLATEYWGGLNNGRSDAEVRSVFGDNYAAKESEPVDRRARLRRTFTHNGRQVEMMKHLKIGRKESAAETLRVHFEWDAKVRKIIIGHCGQHL